MWTPLTLNPEIVSFSTSTPTIKGGVGGTFNGTITLFAPYTGSTPITVSSNKAKLFFPGGSTTGTVNISTGTTTIPFTMQTATTSTSFAAVVTLVSPLGYASRKVTVTITP